MIHWSFCFVVKLSTYWHLFMLSNTDHLLLSYSKNYFYNHSLIKGVLTLIFVLQWTETLCGTLELYSWGHSTCVLEGCLLDFPVSYLVPQSHKLLKLQPSFVTILSPRLSAGCCCRLCSHTLGRGPSPGWERLRRLSLKMQSITAPTYLFSSACSYTWLPTHSGNSHGKLQP